MNTFYGNGKLLISGEYAVLDGALALAVPTVYGQSLTVIPSAQAALHWTSMDDKGKVWFSAVLDTQTLAIKSTNNTKIAATLQRIIKAAKNSNPYFLKDSGATVITKLSFPRLWGLGSSSTLIYNIAQWAQVNAYQLLTQTFGGSGYDIACAQHNTPIYFQLKKGTPRVEKNTFSPAFKDRLFFVYLNKKQDSRAAIHNYRGRDFDKPMLVTQISDLSLKLTKATTLDTFAALLHQHEQILSEVLGIPTVKARLFPDYFGALKSLGGWGGDFVLATGDESTPNYFQSKGFATVIPFVDMVKPLPIG